MTSTSQSAYGMPNSQYTTGGALKPRPAPLSVAQKNLAKGWSGNDYREGISQGLWGNLDEMWRAKGGRPSNYEDELRTRKAVGEINDMEYMDSLQKYKKFMTPAKTQRKRFSWEPMDYSKMSNDELREETDRKQLLEGLKRNTTDATGRKL